MTTAEQIVKLYAEGVPPKAIAAQLGRSVKTVEYHLTHCMRTQRLPSRIHLIHWALATGLAENLVTREPPVTERIYGFTP